MKNWIKVILIIQAIGISNSINAQAGNTISNWNIQDCFDYATAHNISINTFRLNEKYSLQNLSAAEGLKIPSLSGSVGNTFNNGNNDLLGNGKLTNQLNSTGNYSVNAAIVLWNGNLINNNIKQNHLLVQSANLSINQAINNITLLITSAYLNILLSKENLRYVTNLVTTSSSLVKQGQLFYDAGSVAKINLLQLQAQFASDRFLLVQTQNDIRQNILLLKQLLQLPTDSLFDVESPDFVDESKTLPELHSAQENAGANFPEIKIAKLAIEIASLDIKKAKAGFKPVVTANAALGSGYSDVITNVYYPKTGYFKQSGNNFYQRAGITISIPIFSNRIYKTNLEKANIEYSQSNLNLQNEQLILSQAVEQVYLNASNAKQASTAANEQLMAATESFRIINEQFKLGGTNTFQVLQLRNQYVQAVQAYTQAKYTAVLQQKIYEFYLGKPITLQ